MFRCQDLATRFPDTRNLTPKTCVIAVLSGRFFQNLIGELT
ncbi:hypothetical protein D1AOALGA4SA_11422 [Olavius algarvensis Delta 1 endosymbiont]|nr:hypothetical protein D1AOALGA4SA_11422 [Olavius algarvensis Delta 1 endosymbiont]